MEPAAGQGVEAGAPRLNLLPQPAIVVEPSARVAGGPPGGQVADRLLTDIGRLSPVALMHKVFPRSPR